MDPTEFIQQHSTKPIAEVALLLSKYPELDKEFIISQINGLQKAQKKLPEFSQTKGIIYPTSLSIEQCSSEKTAIFKSNILHHSGHEPESNIVDLTGGFGVDSYYFSKQFNSVTYLEPNSQLFRVVTQNFNTLNAKNIECLNIACEDFLKTNTQKFDIAYIDPSRRNENQKVFLLKDCIPDIVDLQNTILKIANKILVKTSPILDIKQTLKELKNVSDVWVISVDNECKEVLYLFSKKETHNIQIYAVNLSKTVHQFSFTYQQEETSEALFSSPLNFLYEPNTSILKAGAFKSTALQYGLNKLSKNTHLYTSSELVDNFPGRVFKIEQILPYQPKQFKKMSIKKANVNCRNFPDTVSQIKKKLNLSDGGNDYIFATSDLNNKPILICCVKSSN